MEVNVEFNDGEVRTFNFPTPAEIKADRDKFDNVFNSLFGSFDSIVQSKD